MKLENYFEVTAEPEELFTFKQRDQVCELKMGTVFDLQTFSLRFKVYPLEVPF